MASVGDLLVSRQLATDGDSSYHNGEPDALPAHAAQLFNGSSASIAEPSTSTSTSAVADEPPRRKRQRQRERRKLSCLECHKRKQQCDKGTPCSRCIKRGVTHLCSYDSADVGSSGSNGISSSDLPLPVLGRQHHQLPATAAATNGAGTDNTSQKVAALESLIRAHMGPKADSLLESIHSRAPSGSGANPEHNAAAALGQLANAHDGISDGQYAYHGPGSVANFIAGSEFLPKIEVSVPLHKPRDLLSAYAFVQSIPPAPVADELTTLFWGTSFPRLFAAATRTEYEPKFAALLQWRDMVKAGGGDPNAIPLPLSGALATVALLAICCAIAFQFGPEAKCDEIAQRAGLGQRRAFQHNMMALARACLYQSEEDEPPSLARIEGLLLCGCYNKNEGRPSSNYSLAAQAVRTAQTLGMHREGSNTWRMSPYEAERRRRLWWSLYSYDHFSSFTLGRPHVIHDDDVDVAEPANINFDDLLPGQPVPPSRPLDEPTDETTVLIEIKLARLCGRMSQAVFSVKRSSIQTVARFDKQLRELQESIPARYLSPTAEDLQRNPALPTISTLTIMSESALGLLPSASLTLVGRAYLGAHGSAPLVSAQEDSHGSGARYIRTEPAPRCWPCPEAALTSALSAPSPGTRGPQDVLLLVQRLRRGHHDCSLSPPGPEREQEGRGA